MARQERGAPGTAQKLLTPEELAQANQPEAQAMAAAAAIDGAFAAGTSVGHYQAFLFMGRVVQKGMLASFRRLRDSEAWKHSKIIAPDGRAVWCKTIHEACEVALDTSYSKLAELDKLERDLGEQLLADTQRLGLRRDDLRALKALPAPARDKVREAIADGHNSKAVIAIIEDLADDMEAARKRADVAEQKSDALAEQNKALKDELRARKEFVPHPDSVAKTEAEVVAFDTFQQHLKAAGVEVKKAVNVVRTLQVGRPVDDEFATGMIEEFNVLLAMIAGWQAELRRWHMGGDRNG